MDAPVSVGFSNLPTQAHRKAAKKGFELTVMVVGESGLGKSTLISSLFLLDQSYLERAEINHNKEISQRTTNIESFTSEIDEAGVKVRLTIVDTPGYGDGLDSTQDIAPIVKYVDEQYERYYRDESGLNRRNIADTRVHCCLYFISPFGAGLKPIDKEFMRQLQQKVNLVPIIGRADCLKPQELQRMKQKIMEQIQQCDIKIFQIPEAEVEEDAAFQQQCNSLKQAIPFAVCGSNQLVEVRGKRVRGRVMPWGVVEIENREMCDTVWLKTLMTTHMNDLREVTHEVLYEAYRAQRLMSGGAPSGSQHGQQSSSSLVSDVSSQEKERLLAEKEQQLRELERKLKMQQLQMQSHPGNSIV